MKRCNNCNKVLIQHEKENVYHFNKRKSCSTECRLKYMRKNYLGFFNK